KRDTSGNSANYDRAQRPSVCGRAYSRAFNVCVGRTWLSRIAVPSPKSEELIHTVGAQDMLKKQRRCCVYRRPARKRRQSGIRFWVVVQFEIRSRTSHLTPDGLGARLTHAKALTQSKKGH